MTDTLKLQAFTKQKTGKGASRNVREQQQIPAVMYGSGLEPAMLSVKFNEFIKEYQKGGIKTRLAQLHIDGQDVSAIVKEVQTHPVTDFPIHIDFLRVGEDTVVRVDLAIHLVNEDKAPGLKKGGIANIVNRKVQFWCHPAHIPHHVEVDMNEIEIGDVIHIGDVKLPEGVRPVDKSNFTVVTVIGRAEEVAAEAGA
jgi:large subunit ribosomal protein L25